MNNTTVAFGELLWDRLPTGDVLGGAPANFSLRAHELGLESLLVSRVGRDQLGDDALRILGEKGLDLSYVQRDDSAPTGTVDVHLDPNKNATYTINSGVAYDAIQFTPELKHLAQRAALICYGSLIQRAPASRGTLYQLLSTAQEALKLVDINLRKGCYSVDTIEKSLQLANILKLNNDEVDILTDLLGISSNSFKEFSSAIVAKYDVDIVVVTRGADGVYAYSRGGEEVDIPGRSVEVVDTIGAGDAFTAGFASRLVLGADLRESCEFGNKLGALVAGTEGGMSPINL